MGATDSNKIPAKTGNYNPVELENEVAERWKKDKIFEKSIENRRSSKPFTFLEGPPTANGKPGIHHVLSRLFKDMVCRWKTDLFHFWLVSGHAQGGLHVQCHGLLVNFSTISRFLVNFSTISGTARATCAL